MNPTSTAISRRACMGMMMGALLGCRSSELARAAPQPEIAITIDDFDVNAGTPRLDPDARNAAILATLQAAGIHAAAFVTGKRVDSPDGKRRLALWSEAGHVLANHSYSHWNYPRVDFEAFSADVLRAEAVIASYPMFRKWFRFPYLKEGTTYEQRDRMRAFLKAHGYRMGYVTVDASDWAIDSRLRKRLVENPQASLDGYRDFYVEHIWERTQFYDGLARLDLPGLDSWMGDAVRSLGLVISSIAAIVDPDLIVLGGRMPALLANEIIPRLEFVNPPRRDHPRPVPKVVASQVVHDATAVGAGSMPLRDAFFALE